VPANFYFIVAAPLGATLTFTAEPGPGFEDPNQSNNSKTITLGQPQPQAIDGQAGGNDEGMSGPEEAKAPAEAATLPEDLDEQQPIVVDDSQTAVEPDAEPVDQPSQAPPPSVPSTGAVDPEPSGEPTTPSPAP
jgi:hypothetical protein